MNVLSINGANEPIKANMAFPSEAQVDTRSLKESNEKINESSAIIDTKATEKDVGQQQKESKKETEDVVNAIEVIDSFMNHQTKNVSFMIDEDADRLVIKVIDAKNNELIKQFPSEEILEMAKKVKGLQQEIGKNTGILIDNKV